MKKTVTFLSVMILVPAMVFAGWFGGSKASRSEVKKLEKAVLADLLDEESDHLCRADDLILELAFEKGEDAVDAATEAITEKGIGGWFTLFMKESGKPVSYYPELIDKLGELFSRSYLEAYGTWIADGGDTEIGMEKIREYAESVEYPYAVYMREIDGYLLGNTHYDYSIFRRLEEIATEENRKAAIDRLREKTLSEWWTHAEEVCGEPDRDMILEIARKLRYDQDDIWAWQLWTGKGHSPSAPEEEITAWIMKGGDSREDIFGSFMFDLVKNSDTPDVHNWEYFSWEAYYSFSDEILDPIFDDFYGKGVSGWFAEAYGESGGTLSYDENMRKKFVTAEFPEVECDAYSSWLRAGGPIDAPVSDIRSYIENGDYALDTVLWALKCEAETDGDGSLHLAPALESLGAFLGEDALTELRESLSGRSLKDLLSMASARWGADIGYNENIEACASLLGI